MGDMPDNVYEPFYQLNLTVPNDFDIALREKSLEKPIDAPNGISRTPESGFCDEAVDFSECFALFDENVFESRAADFAGQKYFSSIPQSEISKTLLKNRMQYVGPDAWNTKTKEM